MAVITPVTAGTRNGVPERRDYRWRAGASQARHGDLEELRKALDRQAGYGRKPSPPPRGTGPAPEPVLPAAPAPAGPASPEPAPPVPPAPAERCRVCKYLKSSIGHTAVCG